MTLDEDHDTRTWDELENWQPCGTCPECGSPAERGNWFDDHPNNGGACIGHKDRCTSDACDYLERS
jgi:hypothetical protein